MLVNEEVAVIEGYKYAEELADRLGLAVGYLPSKRSSKGRTTFPLYVCKKGDDVTDVHNAIVNGRNIQGIIYFLLGYEQGQVSVGGGVRDSE